MSKNTLTTSKVSTFDFISIGKQVLAIEQKGLAQLERYINDDFHRACEMLFCCCGKVVVMGMGKSGHVGRKLAATLASTGTPAFFIHSSEANHGDLGMISSQDIVVALSNSGESHEIIELVPILKHFNIPLICMTGKSDSTMGKAAAIHLCISSQEEACLLGVVPTTSTTAMMVMGDALAVALLQARDFTTQDFALFHPGGALGRKLLLCVSDIMHSGDDIPIIPLTASLRDAILAITRKNLGVTVICDNKNTIAGIFTDGDLRRVFEMNIDLNQARIIDVMTPGGIRIDPSMLAVDALQLMKVHDITSLLIAQDDHLIGIVNMHDILHAGVMI